ncbi:MAG: acetyl-CoA carboxylase biotin carboxyl carrier protein [Candidatus Gastranaerophilales bacterium]|nr:acetyl-CoA carboxylase biotin carboxyl carrier protein [Candidatus Gastranaerophilales bacterium]
MKFDIDYIEKLAEVLTKSDLTEITLEDTDKAIVLKREKNYITAQAAPQMIATPAAPVSTVTSQVIETKKDEPKAEAPKGKAITSPMVGTFYGSPSPDSKAFVEVGDTVAKGQVVCIIEAMKLMNEIEAEVSGKVTEICVENGQTVEFGQVLMYVE